MTFYNIIGWLLIVVAVIGGSVIYGTKKKFYLVVYLISLFSYIYTLVFIIDVYELSKNWTLFLLALTAAIFMLIGFYISKKFKHKNEP